MLRSSLFHAGLLLASTVQALTPMPDPVLRSWANVYWPGCIVGTSIDENHPGVLGATSLWIDQSGIQDLTGLSAFTNVSEVNMYNLNLGVINELPPQVTSLTVNSSQFTAIVDSPTLTYLGIQYNNLTTVQLGYYPQLNTFSCAFNQLTSLDLTSCPSLGYLNCGHNQLTSITGYGAFLNTLLADHNQLSSLSVPGYCSWLDISHNQFTALPLMNTNVQRTVVAHHNQISTFQWGGGNQPSYLDLSHNQLTSAPNLAGAALGSLNLGNNPLTALDALPVRLEELWVDSTPIGCLPYLNRYLEELHAQGTALTCIPNQPPGLVMSAANFGFTPAVCGAADPLLHQPAQHRHEGVPAGALRSRHPPDEG